MNQNPLLIGCLAKFALSGAAFTAPAPGGTVSNTVIPSNDATIDGGGSVWLDLGTIEECQEKVDSTKIPIFGNTPGKIHLKDELETKPIRTLQCRVNDCSNYAWLLLRRALKPTSPFTGAIGQFVPLSVSRVRGWVKFQRYDGTDEGNDALIDAEQLWSKIMIDNAVTYGGDKNVMFDLVIKQLWSPLNSATAS